MDFVWRQILAILSKIPFLSDEERKTSKRLRIASHVDTSHWYYNREYGCWCYSIRCQYWLAFQLKQTLDATTCRYYHQEECGVVRRFRSTRNLLHYRQLQLFAENFFADTFYSHVQSVRGFTCDQVYGNKFAFLKAFLMDAHDKQSARDTLSLIIQDVGVISKALQ